MWTVLPDDNVVLWCRCHLPVLQCQPNSRLDLDRKRSDTVGNGWSLCIIWAPSAQIWCAAALTLEYLSWCFCLQKFSLKCLDSSRTFCMDLIQTVHVWKCDEFTLSCKGWGSSKKYNSKLEFLIKNLFLVVRGGGNLL